VSALEIPGKGYLTTAIRPPPQPPNLDFVSPRCREDFVISTAESKVGD
jgi:hypothetical protein